MLFVYKIIYVRATCFDLVGHPQALKEHRSKRCVGFLHYGIPYVLGGPEDDLLGRNMSP